MNGEVIFFSHGTKHSKGVCILINPLVQDKIDCCYSDKSGRIVLITIVINSLMKSLCNIYAPNNQAKQLEFLQELSNCLIDKSELATLFVGGNRLLVSSVGRVPVCCAGGRGFRLAQHSDRVVI